AISADCGARSARTLHEADAVPHEFRFADRPSAAGGGGKERSDRGGGVESQFRRGDEYPLGAEPGGRRRAGFSWTGEPENTCEAGVGRAAGSGWKDPALHAFGDGELQSIDGAVLQRPEPFYGGP